IRPRVAVDGNPGLNDATPSGLALRTQHSALRTQHSGPSTQNSALSTRHSPISNQNSALRTQNSKLGTQHSAYIPCFTRAWQTAERLRYSRFGLAGPRNRCIIPTKTISFVGSTQNHVPAAPSQKNVPFPSGSPACGGSYTTAQLYPYPNPDRSMC